MVTCFSGPITPEAIRNRPKSLRRILYSSAKSVIILKNTRALELLLYTEQLGVFLSLAGAGFLFRRTVQLIQDGDGASRRFHVWIHIAIGSVSLSMA